MAVGSGVGRGVAVGVAVGAGVGTGVGVGATVGATTGVGAWAGAPHARARITSGKMRNLNMMHPHWPEMSAPAQLVRHHTIGTGFDANSVARLRQDEEKASPEFQGNGPHAASPIEKAFFAADLIFCFRVVCVLVDNQRMTFAPELLNVVLENVLIPILMGWYLASRGDACVWVEANDIYSPDRSHGSGEPFCAEGLPGIRPHMGGKIEHCVEELRAGR